MFNQLLNTGWKQGLVVGLIVGGLLAWLIHIGAPEDLGIDKAVNFLAAIPPFTLGFVMEWPENIQLGILVTWWALIGAALGHLLRGGPWPTTIALLFAATLLSSHNLAYDNVNLGFKRVLHNLEYKLGL